MAVTLKRLISGSQLTTSAATYYTTPAATTTRLDKVTLTNVTTSIVTATMYLVPGGSSAGNNNIILSAKGIAPGETYTCPEAVGHNLAAAGFVRALASAPSALTLMASGVEVT